MRAIPFLSVAILFLVGCASEHGADADGPPTAPTGVAVSNLSGGAHLTWTDNADNEEHYMIMRKTATEDYDDVAMLAFNTVQYHDTTVTAGTTYTYMIVAMNGKGEAPSNEVTFTP
jgi:hypothetical protein